MVSWSFLDYNRNEIDAPVCWNVYLILFWDVLQQILDDSWKEEFEKTLYEEYGVVPDHYEYIGNDVYQVYVKIDGKIVPYVVVNWKTGDFHG